MNNAAIITTARKTIEEMKARNAWCKGVKMYALELIDTVEDWLSYNDELPRNLIALRKIMLDGACDWHQYSWGGCSLIYDRQIAERLCTPSELKRTHNGIKDPNPSEQWLDLQARALYHAELVAVDALLNAIDTHDKM